MRYDQTIYFVSSSPEQIDWDSGEYTEGSPRKIARACSISDMGLETQELLFGGVVKGAKVIAVKEEGPEEYDYLEDEKGKQYQVGKVQRPRHDTVYQVRSKQ